jgi:hypothetical protein
LGFVYRQQLCLTGINEASSAGEITHERTTNPSWSWWNAHLHGLLEKTLSYFY